MTDIEDFSLLGRPLVLPCGVQLKNRIVKSAMSDSLADGQGNPTKAQIRLYQRWSEGGAGLSLIGEVQVTPDYPEKPGNLVLVPDADIAGLQELARLGSASGAQIWPQLGHAGALAHAPISTPKGPSPLDVEGLKCEGLKHHEVRQLPAIYAQAAGLAQSVGFGGVLIHAGHGFLLSQFLSPLFNQRIDEYGGTIDNRTRILHQIIASVREAVGPGFAIAIKINSTDMLEGGLTPVDALKVVSSLGRTSLDLIEISGGTYFPGAASTSEGAASSGPYFLEFSARAKTLTSIPIAVTGGFTNRTQAVEALKCGACDAVSIARGMVLDPSLANKWLHVGGGDPEFPLFDRPPKGGVTAWYSMRMTALSEDREDQFVSGPRDALKEYDARDAARIPGWRDRFGN